MEPKKTSVKFHSEDQISSLDLDLVMAIEDLMRQRMKDEGYINISQERYMISGGNILTLSTRAYN